MEDFARVRTNWRFATLLRRSFRLVNLASLSSMDHGLYLSLFMQKVCLFTVDLDVVVKMSIMHDMWQFGKAGRIDDSWPIGSSGKSVWFACFGDLGATHAGRDTESR